MRNSINVNNWEKNIKGFTTNYEDDIIKKDISKINLLNIFL